jgi:plastocyanin
MKKLLTNTGSWVCIVFSVILLSRCSPAPEKKAAPKTYTVEITQMQFRPAELAVQVGDTVVWVNHDLVAHNVTEAYGKNWTSSEMPAGASWRMAVTGSADYYCSIHPVMKGKLLVQ